MVSLQEDYQLNIQNENDLTSSLSMEAESLHLPLDGSMCMMFTGHYNGIGVEIRSLDEMTLLHHMGCFGKGSSSRSKPKVIKNNGSPYIMRRRQFLKRNYWYKRFGKSEKSHLSDSFFKDINNLTKKIVNDTKAQAGKDIIDLVSSDENESEENDLSSDKNEFNLSGEQNIVVLVPNSDSEDDNYFSNMKPKCCINKIILQEKLMLTLEEAFFLLYGLGCLQIVDNSKLLNIDDCWKIFSDSSCKFIEKYVVYHYFRSKGYVVKPGIKFGGDYLLYREGPGINHADYIVVINFGTDSFNWISILGHVRMATTTVKEVMIAEVIKPQGEHIPLPQNLSKYRVRELVLTRKFPVIIDGGED